MGLLSVIKDELARQGIGVVVLPLMHMLFDWNGSLNIDVFVVAAPNSMFGAGVVRTGANASSCDAGSIQNCLWNTNFVTDYKPVAGQVWYWRRLTATVTA